MDTSILKPALAQLRPYLYSETFHNMIRCHFMEYLNHMTRILWFVVASLILFACQPQEPILIVITPTAQTAESAAAFAPTVAITTLPTEKATQRPPTATSNTPTTLDVDVPTSTPAPPSATAEGDDGTFIGAVIGEGYTLPPSNTPRPSRTPIPSETPFPSETPIPPDTPVVTPIENMPGLDPNNIGIQVDYNVDIAGWDHVLAQAGQLRVGWIKLQANWKFLQPDFPGQFDQTFGLFQLHVQEADKRGFKVLLSIAKAPDWARNIDRNEDGPPDDPQQLINFITLLLEKVGPNIDAIEVWNEPNLKREWTGGYPFSGEGYMQLFRPAYDAVRVRYPDMTIVTAGLAPTGSLPNVSVNDRVFLQQMYDAGLAQYQDISIGIHPYSWGNPPDTLCCNAVPNRGWDDDPSFFFANNIADYREIVRRNNHDVAMWTTEFGWATWDGLPTEPPQAWMIYNTPQQQADYTLRAFEIGQESPDLGPMLLWNLNFANPTMVEQRNEIAGYSLLLPGFDTGSSLQERPLYWALVNRP